MKCANCGLELFGYITCQSCEYRNESEDEKDNQEEEE